MIQLAFLLNWQRILTSTFPSRDNVLILVSWRIVSPILSILVSLLHSMSLHRSSSCAHADSESPSLRSTNATMTHPESKTKTKTKEEREEKKWRSLTMADAAAIFRPSSLVDLAQPSEHPGCRSSFVSNRRLDLTLG